MFGYLILKLLGQKIATANTQYTPLKNGVYCSRCKQLENTFMKQLIFGIILLSFTQVFAQNKFPIEHCDCEDIIAQEDGVLNGEYKRICDGVLVEQGEFIDSKKDSTWTSWSKKGNLIRIFNYSNGVPNGDIKFFYPNGEPKVEGTFVDGKKGGEWSYFNDKGKVIKTGNFKHGLPEGIWKVFDWKGKKELFIYDFTNKTYITESGEETYFKPAAIKQNDNTEEWYILHYPKRVNKADLMPIEGFILSNDIYVNLMEVPLEIWDTYMQYDLNVEMKIKAGGIESIETINSEIEDQNPLLIFAISTNDKEKLEEVEYSELTMKLLHYKVMEVLWLMGPWYGTDGSVKIQTAYVVNKFRNSPLH